MKKEVRSKESKAAEEKKLTKKQQELLKQVFRFRFVTAQAMAEFYTQLQVSGVWVRLEKLVAMGLLAKRYNGHYKIHGRAAEYYVTPLARIELRTMVNTSEREIKQLYSRSKASDRFVTRSLSLLTIRNQLVRRYGKRLEYFTKVHLNLELYEYFPQPLPDAVVRLANSHGEPLYFFLDYFDDAVSLGIHARRLNVYHQYLEDGGWSNMSAEFPRILLVCQSRNLARRLSRRARRFVDSEYSDIEVRVIALDDLNAQIGSKWAIWTDPQNESDHKVAL